jgi:hypothetical protein
VPTESDSSSSATLLNESEIQTTLDLPALPLVVSVVASFCNGGYAPGCRLIYTSNIFLIIYRLQTNSKLGASCETIVNAFQHCSDVEITNFVEKVLKEEQDRKKVLAMKRRMVYRNYIKYLYFFFLRKCLNKWVLKIKMEL